MDPYKLPLDFVRMFESNIRNLSKCNEKESIDQNIEMIITTCPGEHKYDPEFGCQIWDLDFEKIVSKSIWEKQFIKFVGDAVKKYESRICEVEPSIHISDIKKRTKVDIRIDAKIVSTGTRCCFYYSLYLEPLSSK